jgi:hypothetical protein
MFQPEGFNSPTKTIADGATILDAHVDQTKNVFFSCELVYDGTDTGIIFEMGSATTGALVGISATELVIRYGDGGAAPLTNGARLAISVNLLPLNRRFKLSWFFMLGHGLFWWIDGRLQGRALQDGVCPVWADGGDGGYGFVSTPPTETGITTAYDGVLLAGLRYYEKQAPGVYNLLHFYKPGPAQLTFSGDVPTVTLTT